MKKVLDEKVSKCFIFFLTWKRWRRHVASRVTYGREKGNLNCVKSSRSSGLVSSPRCASSHYLLRQEVSIWPATSFQRAIHVVLHSWLLQTDWHFDGPHLYWSKISLPDCNIFIWLRNWSLLIRRLWDFPQSFYSKPWCESKRAQWMQHFSIIIICGENWGKTLHFRNWHSW